MNTRTLKALKASIAHWDRLASGKRRDGETTGPEDCALCGLFWDGPGCDGCPVYAKTGAAFCRGTPFKQAYLARRKFGLDSASFKSKANVELAFLKSLLPNKTKPKL